MAPAPATFTGAVLAAIVSLPGTWVCRVAERPAPGSTRLCPHEDDGAAGVGPGTGIPYAPTKSSGSSAEAAPAEERSSRAGGARQPPASTVTGAALRAVTARLHPRAGSAATAAVAVGADMTVRPVGGVPPAAVDVVTLTLLVSLALRHY